MIVSASSSNINQAAENVPNNCKYFVCKTLFKHAGLRQLIHAADFPEGVTQIQNI